MNDDDRIIRRRILVTACAPWEDEWMMVVGELIKKPRDMPEDALVALEVNGVYAFTRPHLFAAFLPGVKERRRGSIVTLSSAAARRAHPATSIPEGRHHHDDPASCELGRPFQYSR